MLDIKQEIGDLKVSMIETGVDVGPAIYLARIFETDIDSVVKFFIFILIFVFDPMAVALVISYNIAMVNRQRGSLDSGTTVNPTKKKRPKRFGLYREGKSMMEKIVKETFSPDPDEKKLKKKVKREVKKVDKVITGTVIVINEEEEKHKKLEEERLHRGAIVPSTDKRKLEHYKKR